MIKFLHDLINILIVLFWYIKSYFLIQYLYLLPRKRIFYHYLPLSIHMYTSPVSILPHLSLFLFLSCLVSVSVLMRVCAFVCMCICVHMFVYMRICHSCVHTCACVHVHPCVHLHASIYVHMCRCVHTMWIRVCMCMSGCYKS